MIGPQKYIEQALYGRLAATFIQAQPQLAVPKNAQVNLYIPGAVEDCALATADIQGQGVEEPSVDPLQPFAR